MKITKVQPEPVKPNIVITLSHEEAEKVANYMDEDWYYRQTKKYNLSCDIRDFFASFSKQIREVIDEPQPSI
jgi:hypothetical protein